MSAITITLTYPPSANKLWRNYKGRSIKSAEYRAWLKLNGAEDPIRRFRTIAGPYRMTAQLTAPDKRRRDLSNTIKATEDCLQALGVIADDANCRRLVFEWVDGPGAGVTCTIEPEEVAQ